MNQTNHSFKAEMHDQLSKLWWEIALLRGVCFALFLLVAAALLMGMK